MALQVNSIFGHYRIGEVIGEGGMGQVYRATDTTLEREVAIKVLPDSFVADAERIARFEREAKTLASLNHNNIAQIYGIEKGAVTAIVMELVEGPTLADRIAQGPLSPDEALRIARQIIDGLEAAHDKGIVHRDLKPANIKVKADGLVKILDFGIAKSADASSNSGRHTPTMITPAVTESGVIMGTAAYMSPEQARGKFVDERTDIWAFGCLLYEMLTGQPAFGGSDVAETMARIITLDAETSSLSGDISPNVNKTIKLCLQKDVKKRIADIRDVRLSLAGDFAPDLARAQAGDAVKSTSAWQRLLMVAVPLVAGAAIAGSIVWYGMQPAPEPVNRFVYSIPQSQGTRQSVRSWLAVAPNGRAFAYSTISGVYLRNMDEPDARLLLDTPQTVNAPWFSPDSQFVAYYSLTESAFKRISVTGGAPVTMLSEADNPLGFSWASDNYIYYATADGIFRLAANGGKAELIVQSEPSAMPASPQLLPDGETILYTSGTPGNWDTANIMLYSIASGESKVLLQGGADARYVAGGYLLYAIGSDLFAAPFDVNTLSVTGAALSVVQGVERATFSASANFGMSESGTAVYVVAGSSSENHRVVWIDRAGNEEQLNIPPRNYQYAQLSPDGTHIALDSRDDNNDIWIFDIARENLQRLTLDAGFNRAPLWAPDGRLLFTGAPQGQQEEIYIQAADGSGQAEQVTMDSSALVFPTDITADGGTLLFWNTTRQDIWSIAMGEPGAGSPLVATPADEWNATLSPDGRWMAYQSNESGQYEIYVRPYPDIETARIQVSRGGGVQPLWNPDGRELFYLDLGGNIVGSGALMSVPVQLEPDFTPGTPVKLFENNFVAPNQVRMSYDISPDGQKFLMIQNVDGSGDLEGTDIVIMQNWDDELQRLLPRD